MRHIGGLTGALAAGALALGLAAWPGAPATAGTPAAGTPAAGGLACRVEPTVTSTSTTAFTLDLTIRNTGGTVIDGWTLQFPLAAGHVVTSVRNATRRPLSGAVVAVNVASNRLVEPGAAVDVGFTVAYLGQPVPPTSFTINGVPCAVA